MGKVRQHSVPRFYLRQFTPVSSQQVLWEYSKERERPKRRSPKSAAVRSHLYSLRRTDGSWDESVEDQLQRVESAAAGPLKNLASGATLAAGDRETVAFFIGLMFLRVLGYREHAAKQAKRMRSVEATLKFLEERSIAAKILPHELVEAYKQEVVRRGYGVELPCDYHLVRFFRRAWGYDTRR